MMNNRIKNRTFFLYYFGKKNAIIDMKCRVVSSNETNRTGTCPPKVALYKSIPLETLFHYGKKNAPGKDVPRYIPGRHSLKNRYY